MSIANGVLQVGIILVTEMIKRIWDNEAIINKPADQKRKAVYDFAVEFMQENNFVVDNIEVFISDIVDLLNKHDFFTTTKKDDQ